VARIRWQGATENDEFPDDEGKPFVIRASSFNQFTADRAQAAG